MRRPWQLMTTRTIDLDHTQLFVLEGKAGTQVRVLYGGVWLTASGDLNDHFPLGGEEITLRSKTRALIQSLRPTRIEISEPVRAGWLHALTASLRSWFLAVLARPQFDRVQAASSH